MDSTEQVSFLYLMREASETLCILTKNEMMESAEHICQFNNIPTSQSFRLTSIPLDAT
jgi:hypothetical protein